MAKPRRHITGRTHSGRSTKEQEGTRAPILVGRNWRAPGLNPFWLPIRLNRSSQNTMERLLDTAGL